MWARFDAIPHTNYAVQRKKMNMLNKLLWEYSAKPQNPINVRKTVSIPANQQNNNW